jgi:hypothetical protein
MLSVYVCTFDARQHVVFINKLFEFEFYIPEFPNNIVRTKALWDSLYLNRNGKLLKEL